MWLTVARVLGVFVCLTLTGAAVLVPEHPWLQLLATAACGAFGWMFGVPPGVLLALLLARMRPERLAALVQRATDSMPPASAQMVLQSLHPPPDGASIPPVPVVFDSDAADGWESPAVAKTPTQRPRRHDPPS